MMRAALSCVLAVSLLGTGSGFTVPGGVGLVPSVTPSSHSSRAGYAASPTRTFSGRDATATTSLLRHNSNGKAAQSLISGQSRRGNAARRAALPPLRMGLLDAFTNFGKTPVGVDPSVTPQPCIQPPPSTSLQSPAFCFRPSLRRAILLRRQTPPSANPLP